MNEKIFLHMSSIIIKLILLSIITFGALNVTHNVINLALLLLIILRIELLSPRIHID